MKYADKKFSVPLSGQKYADGWDRIFGKKKPRKRPAPAEPPAEKDKP